MGGVICSCRLFLRFYSSYSRVCFLQGCLIIMRHSRGISMCLNGHTFCPTGWRSSWELNLQDWILHQPAESTFATSSLRHPSPYRSGGERNSWRTGRQRGAWISSWPAAQSRLQQWAQHLGVLIGVSWGMILKKMVWTIYSNTTLCWQKWFLYWKTWPTKKYENHFLNKIPYY